MCKIKPVSIAEITAREKAATPGPWRIDSKPDPPMSYVDIRREGVGWPIAHMAGRLRIDIPEVTADAEFIAHAREDVPWLLKRIAQLELESGALTNELKGICWACKNHIPWEKSVTGNVVTCNYLRERGVVAAGGRAGKNCAHWQWRGLPVQLV